jgi:integrase
MRQGEILGLRWQDVDFKNRTISIRQILNHNGKTFEPGAKTASGIRSIGIDKVTADELEKLHRRIKEEKMLNRDVYVDNDLVICTIWGTPLSPRNLNRSLYRLIENEGTKEAPLKKIRFHDLRHSHVVVMLLKMRENNNCTISVKQTLAFLKDGGFIVKEPKTKGSKRDVSVPRSLIADIKALKLQAGKNRLQAGDLWVGGDRFFVFSAWDGGKPLNPSSVKTWWTRFIKRHGLKYITFHSLRHTSAALLINEGVHAKIISERLGHSNIMTTMNIYGHVLKKADQEAANKFDNLLKPRALTAGKQA